MDDVEKLMNKIINNEEINNCRFNNSFLNSVAEVFRSQGFGATRLFLKSKEERIYLERQATALLNVLEIMEKYQIIIQNRGIGGLVIKSLNSILKENANAKNKKL